MGQKWYEKTWVIILFLIFFFPVGIFLMWRNENWKKGVKIAISIIFAIAVIGSVNGSKDNSVATNTNQTVTGNKVEENKAEDTKVEEKTSEQITKEKVDLETKAAAEAARLKAEEQRVVQEKAAQEKAAQEKAAQEKAAQEKAAQEQATQNQQAPSTKIETEPTKEQQVYITPTGKKYHSKAKCGNTHSSTLVPLSEAEKMGLTPCSKCF